jgi:hypothetical protein
MSKNVKQNDALYISDQVYQNLNQRIKNNFNNSLIYENNKIYFHSLVHFSNRVLIKILKNNLVIKNDELKKRLNKILNF